MADELIVEINALIENSEFTQKKFNDLQASINPSNFYIAIAGLKKGYISPEEFYFKYMSAYNSKEELFLNVDNFSFVYQSYWDAKGYPNGLRGGEYIHSLGKIFFADESHYDEPQVDILGNFLKTGEVPIIAIPSSFASKAKIFVDKGYITQKDYEALNLIEGKRFEELNVGQLLSSLSETMTPVPKTIEDAMRNLKNKSLRSLTIHEANILFAFAKKVMHEAGVNSMIVDRTYDIDESTMGYIRNNESGIHLKNLYGTVSECIHTIFHETNHLIQNRNIREMNVEKDEDILEYSKEQFLRGMIKDMDYYNYYYRSISSEFDADFKATLQTQILLRPKNKKYENFAQKIDDYRSLFPETTFGIKRDNTRGEVCLDELFDEYLKTNFFNNPDWTPKEQFEDINFLKSQWPILLYDYDFENKRRRSIEELVQCAITKDKKEKAIYLSIIKSRCNPYKVGEEKASENKALLQVAIKKGKAKSELDKFVKYMKFKSNVDKYNDEYVRPVKKSTKLSKRDSSNRGNLK